MEDFFLRSMVMFTTSIVKTKNIDILMNAIAAIMD